ncbi:MAG: sigma-70 family RNA polymerase sigma factor [Candidatus Staskawiczbacteria bacterium]|nr:sigma-70 family RNA polymerase sigma factor [Candidatus Staskawiczbacteria bacterium]
MSSKEKVSNLIAEMAGDRVLRAFILAAIGNHSKADDVMQNVWEAAIKRYDSYVETRPFRPWVFGIAKMEIRKWRQEKARSREVLSPEIIDLLADTALEQADEIDQRLQHIKPCFDQMDQGSRQLLTLRYFDDLKHKEIAVKLGKNEEAIQMATMRALRKLRQLVDERIAKGIPP